MFKKIVFIFLILSLFLFNPSRLNAESQEEVQARINEYTQKLDELNKSKDTLSNQIKILNSQYELALLKITQTENSIKNLEKEINDLSIKINNLNDQLNELSSLYVIQIIQNYKLQKNVPPFAFFFSDNLNNYLKQYKYVSNVQKASQNSLINMETVRSNYDTQKTQKAKKQQELETLQQTLAIQKKSLDSQKTAKNYLLEVTKNDEKLYTKLKQAAEQELASILSAKFVGKREVKKGEALGVMGSTGFSTGAHLHFGLYILDESNIVSWKYVNDTDSSSYLKEHRWPMNGTIRITQERGVTSFSRNYANNFHNGIDMVSNITTIVAVNDGVAYFYRNTNSSLGNHVKLFHKDGKMSLYLHMQ